MKDMDYKELLKKYIRHILDCEGIDYIDPIRGHGETIFTEDELKELKLLAQSVKE